MRHLRAGLILLGFVLFTLPLMPLQALLIRCWRAGAVGLPHWYHRKLAQLLGIRLRIHGRGAGAVEGPMLIVSNHVSWLDVVILSAVLPVRFVAKREVAAWPFFGALARLQQTVFVDRERRHTTGHETSAIAKSLAAGHCVVLFPEGTSGDGRSVRNFKSSYFAAVSDVCVPIVPVTLAFSAVWGLPMTPRELPDFAWYGDMALAPHLWKALMAGPLTVDVVFHPPLSLDQAKARKAAAKACEETIRESLIAQLHQRPDVR
ncbi:MAG: lysophospholipid acyltransferase family protein [Hyphomicrobiales bacterium]